MVRPFAGPVWMSADLNMVARKRPTAFEGRRVVAIRWELDATLPLPAKGFTLSRDIAGTTVSIFKSRMLPGARQAASGSWSIDPAALQNDRIARRTPFDGSPAVPDLPDELTTATLIALLTFMLPEGSDDACALQFKEVAASFANSHESDIELTLKYWNYGPAPSLPDLIAMRTSADPAEVDLYEAVRSHYSEVSLLLMSEFARDFGVAKLLGWGFDDVLPDLLDPALPEANPIYTLIGEDAVDWRARATTRGLEEEYARPPNKVDVKAGATVIGYPAFGPFYDRSSKWKPQAPSALPPYPDLVEAARLGPRLYPAGLACLSWPRAPERGDGARRALHFEAVWWTVERHIFDRATAVDSVPPNTGASTFFRPCPGAESIIDEPLNSWADDVSLAWGKLPFEGWHAYRVRGIDIFGLTGCPSPPAYIRFRDEIAPPPFALRVSEASVTIGATSPSTLAVALLWRNGEEFMAPDAHEFRFYQRWIRLLTLTVEILGAIPVPGDLDTVQVDVRLQDVHGQDLSPATLEACVRGTLMTEDGEYTLLEVTAAATSTVRAHLALGRAPKPGYGALRYPDGAIETGANDPGGRQRLQRERALTGTVRVVSLAPFEIHLSDPTTHIQISPTVGRVYLHLLGASFDATPGSTAGAFALADPGVDENAAAALVAALRQLPDGDAHVFLDGSPALFLPAHQTSILLLPPPDFVTGMLEIEVTAADAVPYQGSAPLIGNEGDPVKIRLNVNNSDPPGTVAVAKPKLIWARGAAEFVESAEADLSWPAATGAFRYEVERVIETALGLPVDADDAALVAAATLRGDACFERRSNHASHNRWIDALPGRAPTRAVYRVRAVTAAGIPSEWSIFAIVRVPDVRIPPPPNFLRAAALDGESRTILCVWTRGGPPEGIGHIIEARKPDPNLHPDEGWETIAQYLPEQIVAQDGGRYSVRLVGQQPGVWREFRVIAIRHALDPDDPRAKTLRTIRGRASLVMRACAEGELRAPEALRATKIADNIVELRWINVDLYECIEVRRRRPGGSGFERFKINGGLQLFRESTALTLSGQWTYELAAIGTGRRITSARVTVEIS